MQGYVTVDEALPSCAGGFALVISCHGVRLGIPLEIATTTSLTTSPRTGCCLQPVPAVENADDLTAARRALQRIRLSLADVTPILRGAS